MHNYILGLLLVIGFYTNVKAMEQEQMNSAMIPIINYLLSNTVEVQLIDKFESTYDKYELTTTYVHKKLIPMTAATEVGEDMYLQIIKKDDNDGNTIKVSVELTFYSMNQDATYNDEIYVLIDGTSTFYDLPYGYYKTSYIGSGYYFDYQALVYANDSTYQGNLDMKDTIESMVGATEVSVKMTGGNKDIYYIFTAEDIDVVRESLLLYGRLLPLPGI